MDLEIFHSRLLAFSILNFRHSTNILCLFCGISRLLNFLPSSFRILNFKAQCVKFLVREEELTKVKCYLSMKANYSDASVAHFQRNFNINRSTNLFAEMLVALVVPTSWVTCTNIFILYSMKKHETLRGPKYVLVCRGAVATIICYLLRAWLLVFIMISETPRNLFDFVVVKLSCNMLIFFLCSSVMYQSGTLLYQYITSWYLVNISKRHVNIASVFSTLIIALVNISSAIYDSIHPVGIFLLFSAVASIGLCLSMLYRRNQREETSLNTSNILLYSLLPLFLLLFTPFSSTFILSSPQVSLTTFVRFVNIGYFCYFATYPIITVLLSKDLRKCVFKDLNDIRRRISGWCFTRRVEFGVRWNTREQGVLFERNNNNQSGR